MPTPSSLNNQLQLIWQTHLPNRTCYIETFKTVLSLRIRSSGLFGAVSEERCTGIRTAGRGDEKQQCENAGMELSSCFSESAGAPFRVRTGKGNKKQIH
jgi:hypothetical protein